MVGLDFTPMDKVLIEHASFLAALIKPEKIYFVNAQQGLDAPEDLLADYPELDAPLDEKLRDELQLEVDQYFKMVSGTEIECLILKGNPSAELNNYVQIKKIDLLITGRKRELKGSGVVPQKLVRKVPASVLFVPEKNVFSLAKVVVPIDFSTNSRMALEEAATLTSADLEHTSITTLHHYKLPSGYYKTGKTEEEFGAIMLENAKKKHATFIAETNLKGNTVNAEYVFDNEHTPGEVVNKFAHEVGATLIVIGGKGRTDASALFLGSTAEKLIGLDKDIPLLVVKDKKATFGLLEMLKKL